jgi:hypothetical protein
MEKLEGNETIIKLRKNENILNPLNAELNPICHLLVLLRANPILHVSRIKVKRKKL